MAITYYLLIDGISSGFVSNNQAINGGFAVSSFDFDIEALISFQKGTGVLMGKATPSPLDLDLTMDAGLSQLLSKITGGSKINSVQLVGINSTAQGDQTVYDLRLKNALVSAFHDREGVDHLSLVYQQVTVETLKYTSTGSPIPPDASSKTGWDLTTNTINTSLIAKPIVPSAAVGTQVNPNSYYLFIDGLNGGVTTKGFEGAFKVKSHSFDVDADASFSSGTGATVGKPIPDALVLDLENMAGGTATLITDFVRGTSLKAVRLVSTTNTGAAQPEVVYDLRLGQTFVTSLQDGIVGDQLSLAYNEVSLTTKPMDSAGKLGAATTTHWNVATMTIDAKQLPAAVPSVSPGLVTAPTKYYLLIDGINSGLSSTNKAINGAFEVSAFDFDIKALMSSNGTAGKATPSPLELDLAMDAGLGQLLGKITGGSKINSVQLVGINSTAQGDQTVYDLRLKNALVSSLHDREGADHLSLVYQQVTVETLKYTSTGSPIPPDASSKTGWDLTTNTINTSLISKPVVPSAAVGTQANSNDYYLFIDGLNGGVTTKGFEGAFKVKSHSFDVNAEASFSSGTGATVGKPIPDALVLDLENMAGGTATLMTDIVKGMSLKAVRLVSTTNTGAPQPEVVYDLRLGQTFVTSLQDSIVGDQLSLAYKDVSLTTKPMDSAGKLGAASTMHWNAATMTIDAKQLPAAVPSISPGLLTAPTKYYLLIDGINSGLVSKNLAINGGFEVSAFDFDIKALMSSNGTTGKATPSPLELDLAMDAGLGQLLGKIAGGSKINSVQLVGINSTTQGGQTVYDLRLKNALVSSLHDREGADHLSLVYQQVTVETLKYTSTGSPIPPDASSKTGWDLTTNTINTSLISKPVVPSAAVGTQANSNDYYLFIDGLNGGVTTKGFEGAFKVKSHSFDVNAEASFSSGTGATVGKPIPDALVLDLVNMDGGTATLINNIIKGTPFTAVRLVGTVNTGLTQSEVVYDLRLGKAFVTTVQDSIVGDQISLAYNEVSLTTKPLDSTGKIGAATTLHWNVVTMTTDAIQLPAAKPLTSSVLAVSEPSTGISTMFLHQGAQDFNPADLLVIAKGDYTVADRTFGGSVTTYASSTIHGNDFMLDPIDFALSVVGVQTQNHMIP